MTFDELSQTLRKITATFGGNNIDLHWYNTYLDANINVSIDVFDTYTGKPTTVSMRTILVPQDYEAFNEHMLISWIHALVQRLILHEFEEGFKVNGQVWHDPHKA